MHALTMLHNILTESCPEVHAKRLVGLLATVEVVVSGSRLTLSDLGRALRGPAAVNTTSSGSTGCWVITRSTPKLQACMKRLPDGIWRG